LSDGARRAAMQLHVAEPPAAYRVLPPLVVDSSVLVAALFREPALEEQARGAMRRCKLHAPLLLEYEIANVALKKASMADEVEVLAALDGLDALEVTLHRVDVKGSFQLARRYALTAYDAAYLWLTGELKAPLATFDRKLANAARQHLGAPRN